MKIRVLTLLFFAFSVTAIAQVGIGTTTPNAFSELDITSTTRGLLIPRMTQAQRVAIAPTATEAGLLVYQIDAPIGLWSWSGTTWTQVNAPSWTLTGNNATVATNFLGTTDAQPLIMRTTNIERMRISPTGDVGIGTNAPTAKLHLVGIGGLVASNSFEGGVIAPYVNGPVITGGAWTVQTTNFTNGSRGAQSGTGVTSSISQMNSATPVIGAAGATVSFDYRVSSEAGFDFFRFYIDNFAVPLVSVSGTAVAGFTSVSFALTPGAHTLRWEYSKDGSGNTGDDRAYIDNVIINTPSSALRIVDGNQGLGKVLTSDASGLATWTTPTIPAGTSWLTAGNAGTTPFTNFVGTTDAQTFVVRTNNLPRINVLANGNVGIGVAAPTAKLDVSENLVGQGIIRATNTNAGAGTISFGILGQAAATSLGSAGVVGISSSGGNNEIGVLGDYGLWGAGVFGKGPNGNFSDMVSLVDHGVFGTVGNSLTGVGVYGKNTNLAGTAFGMYCNGNFAVTGAKSASVPTTQGNQLVYCTESPELWFEDLGFGTLSNGSVHVKLDDMFLETVYIDATQKMHVFLQEEGDSNGLFVTMDADNKGFSVKEKQNGRSNSTFSYRILAKRRFYQNQRFGVDANQPFENNLVKHKDVPVTTTDPKEMKRIVDEYTALRVQQNELAKKSK